VKRNAWRRIAGLLGVVLIGALGSGLWDVIFKPGGQWVVRTLLTAVTLGSSVVKDAVYAEAAKGPHEAASLYLVSILTGALTWPLMFLAYRLVSFRLNAARRSETRLIESLISSGEEDRLASVRHRLEVRSQRLTRLLYLLIVMLLVFIGVLGVMSLKVQQANSAYTHFAQSLSICAPYITEEQSRVFQSRYSRIQGRADYLSVLSDLQSVALQNHISLPAYDPW